MSPTDLKYILRLNASSDHCQLVDFPYQCIRISEVVTSDAAHPSLFASPIPRSTPNSNASFSFHRLSTLSLPAYHSASWSRILSEHLLVQTNDLPSILTDPDSALSLATKWLTAASHSTSFSRLSLHPPLCHRLLDYSSYRPNPEP